MSQSDLYCQFEDRHRGSRELIKGRLTVYLPFLQAILEYYPDNGALDLGCGRGEWLELLNERGFKAKGVDTDAGMLAACLDRNLDVEHKDAIKYLTTRLEHSLSVVSGFHIAEHLPFKQLQKLVWEALRVLQPGGLLILETPNPENLVIGSSVFYLDPTHERPLPPPLLTFLTEYTGFQRVKVLRLQEDPALLSNPSVSLLNVLNGVSPDYAIVAQKKGPPELSQALDSLFAQSFGIELGELATKYDQAIQHEITGIQTAVRHFIEQAKLNEQEIQAIHDQLSETQRQNNEQMQRITQLESRLAEAERCMHDQELRAVIAETRLEERQLQWAELMADRERWIQRAQAAEPARPKRVHD